MMQVEEQPLPPYGANTELSNQEQLSIGEGRIADQVGASASGASNKKPHRTSRRLRLMLAGSLLSS